MKNKAFWNIAFRSEHRFLISFGHPKSTKIHPKIDSKRHQKIDQFWYRFFIDFGSVLGSNLDPCWPPFSAQDGPRGLQNPSKTTQDASKDALDGLKQPKMPPNLPWSPLDLDFWCLQAWILKAFWRNFDPFLNGFGIKFNMQDLSIAVAGSPLCGAIDYWAILPQALKLKKILRGSPKLRNWRNH